MLLTDRARQRFEAEELAIVLSHYDLGIVESITEFHRGSRMSPKIGIVAQRGKFLLKKRAAGRRSPRKVGFAHAVQKHLTAAGFPLPQIVSTCTGQSSVTRLGTDTYEISSTAEGRDQRHHDHSNQSFRDNFVHSSTAYLVK